VLFVSLALPALEPTQRNHRESLFRPVFGGKIVAFYPVAVAQGSLQIESYRHSGQSPDRRMPDAIQSGNTVENDLALGDVSCNATASNSGRESRQD
jgi:hypothetical protein